MEAIGEDLVARLEALDVDRINPPLQDDHVLVDLAHQGTLLQRDGVDSAPEPGGHSEESMGVVVDAQWTQRNVSPTCSRERAESG